MKYKQSLGSRLFDIFNYLILGLFSLTCVAPMLHMVALSFSSTIAVDAGWVSFWPVNFTIQSYKVMLERGDFVRALGWTLYRCSVTLALHLFVCIMTAYPLSKDKYKFFGRNVYMGYIVCTMWVPVQMVPMYMQILNLGLLDTYWALILPGLFSGYNCTLMMNFIRSNASEMEDAALVDGAGPFTTLFRVLVPVLKPSIATIALFNVRGTWDEWFSPTIYFSSADRYPLATYLQRMVRNIEDILKQNNATTQDYVALMQIVSARTGRAAQLLLGALPFLIIYPWMQKYLAKGLTLGSVKG